MDWENKKVLVTGADGFIGSLLVKKLKSLSYSVLEFNRKNGDIATTKLNFQNIDQLFHLAAETFVPKSWEEPFPFYETNILGTVNVLEACRKYGIKLTYISAYVYGIPDTLPIKETHELKAVNPYMHSKILAESLCKFYSDNYDVKVNIIRPFNIYGPGQSDHFLLPKIITQVLSDNKKIEVFDLSPKRDFLYIDDLIDAMILSMNAPNKFNVFNIGSGESYSVKEIIDYIQNLAKTNKPILSKDDSRKNEIPEVIADISYAKEKLNWSPKFSFEKGLTKLIQYYADKM